MVGDGFRLATFEKLDFALRSDSSLINDVGLIVLDEGLLRRSSALCRDIRLAAEGERNFQVLLDVVATPVR